MKEFWQKQDGFVLPLALLVLGIGVLIATPYLAGMSSSLLSVRHSEQATDLTYASAGAYEDAVWNLTHGDLASSLPDPCDSTSYSLTEPVNGVQPNVTVTRSGNCAVGDDDDDRDDGDENDDDGDDDDEEGAESAQSSITYLISITGAGYTYQRKVTFYFCSGMAATVIGSPEAETLTGTDGDDVIVGRAGDDTIIGNLGDDVICGGSGADNIDGGTGHDVISGGSSNDTLSGGSGNDTLKGDGGDDAINGDTDDDWLDGGSGIDSCNGGPGEDTLTNCLEEDDEG